MGLNIKNDEVEAEIRKLAEMTGESLTAAVHAAVRERIRHLREPPARKETLKEHLAALRPLQAALKARQKRRNDTRTSRELIDELYDEHGLPK
jgi:antitoxin VapB